MPPNEYKQEAPACFGQEGIEIGGLRFTTVDYVLCCDMKASNKLQGVAAHGAEFWSTTHVGLSKDSTLSLTYGASYKCIKI